MKKPISRLAALGLLWLAACASSPNTTNAQAATPARDPACAECPPDCCKGEGMAAEKATAKDGSCCEMGSQKLTAPKASKN